MRKSLEQIEEIWDGFELIHGGSPELARGICVMQAVNRISMGENGDHVHCTDDGLNSFMIDMNDSLSHEQLQLLRAFIPRLVNTRHKSRLWDAHHKLRIDGTDDEVAWRLIQALARWFNASYFDEVRDRRRLAAYHQMFAKRVAELEEMRIQPGFSLYTDENYWNQINNTVITGGSTAWVGMRLVQDRHPDDDEVVDATPLLDLIDSVLPDAAVEFRGENIFTNINKLVHEYLKVNPSKAPVVRA